MPPKRVKTSQMRNEQRKRSKEFKKPVEKRRQLKGQNVKKKKKSLQHLQKKNPKTWMNIINPYLGITNCEGGEKSSLFWLNLISNTYYYLSYNNKVQFIMNMTFQPHVCLHKDYHKTILKSLKHHVGGPQKYRIFNHILKLEQKYNKINKTFVCTCNMKSELTDTTAKTAETCMSCEEAERISQFWLGKIREEFIDINSTKKVKFLENMILDAYGCPHKGYHRIIVDELKAAVVGLPYFLNDLIDNLERKYNDMDMNFICTCKTRFTENKNQSNTSQNTCKVPDFINPHSGDTSCDGAEKSSLFWLGHIRKTYYHLSNSKKVDFLEFMISQAHGCLHKDYHRNIIKALKCDIAGQQNSMLIRLISSLEQVYSEINLEFVCTCVNKLELTDKTMKTENTFRPGLTKETLHSENSQETCKNPDSPETNKEDDIGTDLTYESLLDIFDLHD